VFCFDKTHRLLTKKDYDHVFAKANKTVTSEFVILHRKNTLGYARLGLALSKRMIAKANQRNRIKRILRESFRIQKLPAIDLVFLARHGVATVENNLIMASLADVWDKLTIIYVD
jgi:ribonuclease P protein component